MTLDLISLESAIAQLRQALNSYNDDVIQNNPIYKKQMRSAVIQAFEFTYESTFKMIVRYLNASSHGTMNVNIISFNNIIREAYKKTIIGSDLSIWKKYRQKRCITSHTYDEDKAQDVFGIAPEFLVEAQHVLSSLQELNRSLD